MSLTLFDDFNDVTFFECEFVSVCGVVVVDGPAERQVGLGGRWRLLGSCFWRRTSSALKKYVLAMTNETNYENHTLFYSLKTIYTIPNL